MRNVKMTVLIGESFERMADILFRPFSMKKCARLTLIALLAGMLLGSSGLGGGGDSGDSRTAKKESASVSTQEAKTAGEPGKTAASPLVLIIAALGIAFISFVIIFMTWVGARFKFVWLNAVIKNTDSIIEPYSRHRRQGNSFFRLSLSLLVVLILAIALIAGAIIYGMITNGAFQSGFTWHFKAVLNIFLAPVLGAIIFFIAYLVFAFLADHFIVPIMAFDECTSLKALRKLRTIVLPNWTDFMLFTIIFLLLSIVAGTIAGIAGILVFLALLIAALVIFGLPFLLIWVWLKANLVFVIYAVAAGIPFAIFGIITMLTVSLPFAVFFRAFSLKYLQSLNAGYGPRSLEIYSAKKAERISGRAPIIISIIVIFLITFTFIAGLLTAIAIPNFMRAREEAVKHKSDAAIATIKK